MTEICATHMNPEITNKAVRKRIGKEDGITLISQKLPDNT